MKSGLGFALLVGALLVGEFGTSQAQLGQPKEPQLPGEARDTSRLRFADRFLAEFDLNHDGKVTRDEFSKAVAKDFYAATGGGQTMSQEQFIASRTKDLRQRVTLLFHRSDWSGDNKLSYDEFAAPQRALFEQLDRDGVGIVSCSSRSEPPDASANPRDANTGSAFSARGRRGSGGTRGRGAFCAEADLNRDGKVTRGELDTALHQQFQAATKGGAFMNSDQLYALELAHYREMDARIFQHINTSYTGKLTLQEYSASENKFFARLDRNGDGVVTPDELSSRRRSPDSTRIAKSGR